MKMIRWLLLGALILPAGVAGQRGLQGRGIGPRRELEAQVFDRFMTKVSTDMRLNASGRGRLEQYLRQSGRQRRELAQQTVQLRRRLVMATRDSTTSEANIDQLLQQFAQLRVREQELWNRDQAELANQLTPRQRAVFILQWMAFNERIRGIMQGREPPDTLIR
ncbi:MAG: hypothetical protein ACRENP_24265 [Longimicrobiales bacterium]